MVEIDLFQHIIQALEQMLYFGCVSVKFVYSTVWSMLNCIFSRCMEAYFYGYMQITERKPELAKFEAADCGKPLDEAAWDIVRFDAYGDIY